MNIVKFIFSVFLFFFPKRWRNNSTDLIKNLRTSLYSLWIRSRYRFGKCKFNYPINLILGSQYFKIGDHTGFGKFAVLTAWDSFEGDFFNPKVSIGENCNFGDYLHMTCINSIKIGNNVLTGRWVTISDNGHGETDYKNLQIPPAKRKLSCKGPLIICDNVWIGDKATILSGVTIGEGSIIAANAVVTKNIPPYSVAAGNPAKVIKTLTKL